MFFVNGNGKGYRNFGDACRAAVEVATRERDATIVRGERVVAEVTHTAIVRFLPAAADVFDFDYEFESGHSVADSMMLREREVDADDAFFVPPMRKDDE